MKIQSVDMKHIVTIGNGLSEANYRLEMNEQRLVLAFISKIVNSPKHDKFQEILPGVNYSLSVSEFAELYSLTHKYALAVIRPTLNSLYDRNVLIAGEDIAFRWISYRQFNKKTEEVTIKWSPDIIPLISMLKGDFNSYLLVAVAALQSWYSLRIFMLVNTCRRLKHKKVTYSIEQLRDMFCLGDKYKPFGELNKHLLQPALVEINEKSDLRVVLEVNKVGKRVTGVTFIIVEIINLIEWKKQLAKEAAKLEVVV